MPQLLEAQEIVISPNPDRMILVVGGLRGPRARALANVALREARRVMPRLTGRASSRLFPLYGSGYFGIGWLDNYTWFQEQGIRAFTMYALAGKTIPMWVDDPAGTEREKNSKAQVRTTMSGKVQVLIFRRAAMPGARRTVRRKGADGSVEAYTVPASYPGAPGRIARREAARPLTTKGKKGGAVAKGNIGVRWRHPGLSPRMFLNHSISLAAGQSGIAPTRLYVADRGWRSHF
jgi:hypothetical protein